MELQSIVVDLTNHRRVARVSDGLYLISQEINGARSARDVSGPYWILAFFEVDEGFVAFKRSDGSKIKLGLGKHGMFLPPWSIVALDFKKAKAQTLAFFSPDLPESCPRKAVAFSLTEARFVPDNWISISSFLADINESIEINYAVRPNAVAKRLKAALDVNYRNQKLLAEITASIGLERTSAAKTFKAAFGIAPSKYRQWLRVMDGMFELLNGEAPLSASLNVGYSDLSRFYKQFKEIAGSSPGRYGRLKTHKTPRTIR